MILAPRNLLPGATCTRTVIRCGRRAAFTIVELLVVVSIVALLIAMLMPTLSRAREQTRRAICASNQRQLMFAVTSYANSNDEFLPGEGIRSREGQDPNYANDPAWKNMWVGWLDGYTVEHSAPVFYCPSMAATVNIDTAWPAPMPWGGEYFWGYLYFGHYLSSSNGQAYNWAGSLPAVRRLSIANPGSPIFGDWLRGQFDQWGMIAHASGGGLGPFALSYGGVTHMSAPPENGAVGVEPDGANEALLDGSVRWYRPEELEISVVRGFWSAKPQ